MARALLHSVRRITRVTSLKFLYLATRAAEAVPTPFAAPGAQAPPSSGGDLLRVVLALILVLAAVLAAAWISRRLRGVGGARAANLEVLGQLSLGPRERAVLIRVDGERLLLGVANGSVRRLHVLAPASDDATVEVVADDTAGATHAPQRPTFRELLRKSLGK